MAATQLGIARRALDETISLVDGKAPAPTFKPMASSSAVQREISRLEGAWWAARAGVREALAELWEAAQAGDVTISHRRKTAICNHSANAAAGRIVEDAWRLAGTSALSPAHPLARCLRDSRPLLGHISANERILEYADQVRQSGAPLPFALI